MTNEIRALLGATVALRSTLDEVQHAIVTYPDTDELVMASHASVSLLQIAQSQLNLVIELLTPEEVPNNAA